MHEVIVVGAGAAGLMAAQKLAERGFKVSIYEKKKAAARKFLVAGHGGFNLTHAQRYSDMIKEYHPEDIHPYLQNFSNTDTRLWLQSIGIDTYIGSTGKIFPTKGIKPIQVLRAWLNKLESLGVQFHYDYVLNDFDEHFLYFYNNTTLKKIAYHKAVFALGGGSWPQTGSDAAWTSFFLDKNIAITPLQPANCGLEVAIPKDLEGKFIKNIAFTYKDCYKKGEIVCTEYGIEGSPVYFFNRQMRTDAFPITFHLDLKPEKSQLMLENILKENSDKTISERLKIKAGIRDGALALLKHLDKSIYVDAEKLAQHIKHYPMVATGFRPISEAISSYGGIAWCGLNQDLSLKLFPKIYCAGEMLDWEAPTGGYLLQGCFASGYFVGTTI